MHQTFLRVEHATKSSHSYIIENMLSKLGKLKLSHIF